MRIRTAPQRVRVAREAAAVESDEGEEEAGQAAFVDSVEEEESDTGEDRGNFFKNKNYFSRTSNPKSRCNFQTSNLYFQSLKIFDNRIG